MTTENNAPQFGGSDERFAMWLRDQPGARECATYEELCERFGFTERQRESPWMRERFENFRARPDVYTHSPLKFPRVRDAAELFERGAFAPSFPQEKERQELARQGFAYLNTTRLRYPHQFFGPRGQTAYILPKAGLRELAESIFGRKGLAVGYYFDAIQREDGVLITLSADQIIGSRYIALLDSSASVAGLFPAFDPPAPHVRTHSRLWGCALDQTAHDRTCGYWFTVTADGGSPHTAFATRAGLARWIEQRGLSVAGEIPEAGKIANFEIAGSYRTASHMHRPTFDALKGVETREMSNAQYTLAKITHDEDGLRTVHTLNPNVTDRPVFDYQETRKLLGE